MIRKQISAILICLLLMAFTAPFASGQDDKKATAIKSKVAKYGTKKKDIRVKTLYNVKYKGYISRIGADDFDLTNSETGRVSTFNYNEISYVKRRSLGGLNTTLIIVGATVGALFLISYLALAYCKNYTCKDY